MAKVAIQYACCNENHGFKGFVYTLSTLFTLSPAFIPTFAAQTPYPYNIPPAEQTYLKKAGLKSAILPKDIDNQRPS